jgi:hypothetical protein
MQIWSEYVDKLANSQILGKTPTSFVKPGLQYQSFCYHCRNSLKHFLQIVQNLGFIYMQSSHCDDKTNKKFKPVLKILLLYSIVMCTVPIFIEIIHEQKFS